MSEPQIEVRRSARRRKTISVSRQGDRFVVLVPARLSAEQEAEVAASMVERLMAKERRLATPGSDRELLERAVAVAHRYATDHPEIPDRLKAVLWSGAQSRWGSCSAGSGTIRVSARLRGVPAWVVDHVLLHELAHLVHHGHGAGFQAIAGRHPEAVRAEGFLAGYAHGLGRADLAWPDGMD